MSDMEIAKTNTTIKPPMNVIIDEFWFMFPSNDLKHLSSLHERYVKKPSDEDQIIGQAGIEPGTIL